MSLRVVVNSTPLIALAKLSLLSILADLFGEVHIPHAVFLEVAADKKGRRGSVEVGSASWIQEREVQQTTVVEFLMASVDAGEAEAIALAKEVGADLLIIDDRQGRRLAEAVGIPCVGTVGILLRYFRGKPEAFREALDSLMAQGFRLGHDEYQRIIKLSRGSLSKEGRK